jgi:uncharacterized radical SAM superfamily Fe-S cluster-containing enzyme
MRLAVLQLPEAPLVGRGIAVAGYLTAGLLFIALRKRWRIAAGGRLTLRQMAGLAAGIGVGSIAGAGVVGWLESIRPLWQVVTDGPLPPASQIALGAMLGGWMGLEIAKRLQQTTRPSGDVFVFPMLLAMAAGRVAAMLNPASGLRAGLPTDLPWGIDFGDGIARHPTQMYEVSWVILLAGIFVWRLRSHRQRGCMFSQFVFAYLAFAFLIELVRPRYVMAGVPLSLLQCAALAGMAHALWHWKDECCALPAPGRPPIAKGEPQAPEFVELTNSLCATCLKKIEAKILVEGGRVYMQKFCPEHGQQRVLVADDAAYWREARALYKPPTLPLRRNTAMSRGCPHDCGLCPDHEQHSCLAIIEITDQCDLGCPICYAKSSRARQHRSLAQIEAMLDAAVANEGRVNVVQISGGEPTLHPELFAVLDAVRRRPIRHIMLNSNGRRLAEDREFVKQLAGYMPGFEVYLQFDSLRPETLRQIRGADLSDIRRRAVDALEEHGISTTLVVTLKKGVNDGEIGEILEFATGRRCIRGVTFQPIQSAGRLGGFDPATNRLTLTEVRSAILGQHKLFTPADLVPVPCHTDALAMAYAIRHKNRLIPLSKLADPRALLSMGGNTICYEQDPALREHVMRLFSASASPSSAADSLNGICCLPDLPRGSVSYDNVFRVIIMQFMDAWNMDLRSLKRSCVHIVHPDGRLIPFETYNLMYR